MGELNQKRNKKNKKLLLKLRAVNFQIQKVKYLRSNLFIQNKFQILHKHLLKLIQILKVIKLLEGR